MKKYMTAAIISALVISAAPFAHADGTAEIYRADFEVHDEDRTFSAALCGINVNTAGGIITVNGQKVKAMCGRDSRWYVTADAAEGRFNIVLDGKSIFSGQNAAEGVLEISGCDNYTVYAEGKVPYRSMTVTSDKYTVSNGYITGVGSDAAGEIISNLKIDGNASARIVTENGITRSGRLMAADVLVCTDMLGNEARYTFPEADLGGMHSDFFDIDLQTLTIANLPKGLTNEQIKGAIKSDKDFEAAQNGTKLVITSAGNTYEFENAVRPPKSAEIYYTDCDNDEYFNWSSFAANIKTEYTDVSRGNAFEIAPEQRGSNASLKKEIKYDGGIVVISNDIKYNFEDPNLHARQFNAPVVTGDSGDTFYVRERRGELVYRNPDDDYLMGVSSENDKWHNICMVIRPDEKTYSVYYDGENKANGQLPQTFDKVKYLSYTTNAVSGAEGGKMYADNIAVFKPFVQLGAIEYSDGTKTSHNPGDIEQITSLKLIFSNAEYNKINQTAIADSVSLVHGNENIAFAAEADNNTVTLNFSAPLEQGEYTLKITEPETIYGKDGGVYEYSFSAGGKICHVDAETDGENVYAEVRLSKSVLFRGSKTVLEVYDEDMKLCGTAVAETDGGEGSIFMQSAVQTGIPYYVKVFAWSDFESIRPICDGYVKNLAEDKQ